MAARLDFDKIAKGLGAQRRGKVAAGSGWFGALELAAEVAARFRVPARGGRATDPKWTERRLIALRPATLRYLDTLAKKIRRERRVALEPLQLAALLLEQAVLHVSADEARDLVLAAAKRSAPRRRAA